MKLQEFMALFSHLAVYSETQRFVIMDARQTIDW